MAFKIKDPVRYATKALFLFNGDYERTRRVVEITDLDSNFKRAVTESLDRFETEDVRAEEEHAARCERNFGA